jgi:hypothetical protein
LGPSATPALLAELQELAICDGGQYWQDFSDNYWSTKEQYYGKPNIDYSIRHNPSYLNDSASRKLATHLQRRVFQVVTIATVFLLLLTAGKYLLETNLELDPWGWNSWELAAINGNSPTDDYLRNIYSTIN